VYADVYDGRRHRLPLSSSDEYDDVQNSDSNHKTPGDIRGEQLIKVRT